MNKMAQGVEAMDYRRLYLVILAMLLSAGCAQSAPAPVPAPAPAKVAAAVAPPAVAPHVSLLDGKFMFTLPRGFAPQPPAPSPDGKPLDSRVRRLSYVENSKAQVVSAIESPSPNGMTTGDTDNHFLDGMASRFITQQAGSVPGYQSLAIKRLTVNGLAVRQIESVENHGSTRVWTSTLLANSGQLFALVAVTTGLEDKAGHQALVQQVLGGK
jgi:hypothetical protein